MIRQSITLVTFLTALSALAISAEEPQTKPAAAPAAADAPAPIDRAQ